MSSKVITLSLKEEVERELRRLAVKKYGKTKGSLAKVVAEGVKELEKKEKMGAADRLLLGLLESGAGGRGLIKYKSRDELHER